MDATEPGSRSSLEPGPPPGQLSGHSGVLCVSRQVWILWAVLVTGLVMGVVDRHLERLPELERTRVAQWVLTTGWMVQRLYAQGDPWPGCGPDGNTCVEKLGWMAHPRRIEHCRLGVERISGGYRVWGEAPTGSWELLPGMPLRYVPRDPKSGADP